MYTLRYFSYLRERKSQFQVLREEEMKLDFTMNVSKCSTKRRRFNAATGKLLNAQYRNYIIILNNISTVYISGIGNFMCFWCCSECISTPDKLNYGKPYYVDILKEFTPKQNDLHAIVIMSSRRNIYFSCQQPQLDFRSVFLAFHSVKFLTLNTFSA